MEKKEKSLSREEQALQKTGNLDAYRQILKALQEFTGIEFSRYKENTILRRISRRMALNGIDTLERYRDCLLASEEEKTKLYNDIFIGVTEFFRDPAAFRSLYDNVLPVILKEKQEEIRIWSAACCSGEEAYSLAILAYEYMRRHELELPVKIFATDIDQKSVDAAKLGCYGKDRLAGLSGEYREKYFIREGELYRIRPQIRGMVVFARHDLLQDAGFHQLDLIVCRNMFIYLKPETQQELLQLFYRQLKEEGYLFLGGSEMAGQADNAFQAVDIKSRIFRKNTGTVLPEKEKETVRIQEDPLFFGRTRAKWKAGKRAEEKPQNRIRELEISLQQSRKELHCMVAQLRKKNKQLEELNEEMTVSNEELQNTNEEVHSVNEELQSLNFEYRNKIEELVKANADFDNLLQNAQIGALYIDHALCIRKITPIMEQTTNLIAADVGRPVSHICFMNEYPDLEEDVRHSQETGEIIEREVDDEKGIIWLVRIRPYYDWQGQEDGVLVTLFDITRRLEAAKFELKLLNDNLPGGVARMRFDNGLIVEYANKGLYRFVQCSKEEFAEKYQNHYDYLIYPQDWPYIRDRLEQSIRTGENCRLEYRVMTEEGGTGWRMMEAVPLGGDRPVIQCIISDITQLKETQQQLDSLIENIPGGILRLTYDGSYIRVKYVSEKLAGLLGHRKADFSKTLEELEEEGRFSLGGEKEKIYKALNAVLYTGRVKESEYSLYRENGEKIWLELRGSIVCRTDSEVTVQYIVIDITKLGNAKKAARQERERLEVIMSLTADLIFEYDIKTDTMYYFNQNADIANELPVVEHYTDEIMHGDLILGEDRNELQEFCNQLREGRRNISAELRKRYGDGKYHWIAVKARGIQNEKGIPDRVVGKTIIIDERKEKEESLRRESERDSMTGLYNAGVVRKRIEQKLATEKPDGRQYLVVIDVDDFKQINDTMGHLFGDAVIVTFADALQKAFPDGIAGRIGGDEFLLYVDDLHFEEIIRRINLLNAQLCKAYGSEQSQLLVSCSAGIAACDPGNDLKDLVKRADSALYYVKKNRKGAARLYKDYMHIVGDESFKEKKPIAPYTREVVIQTDDDLVLFALEMFEKVPDIKSVIRAISDRMCRYYGIQDIIYLRPAEGRRLHMTYHWGKGENVQFIARDFPVEEQEWQILLYGHDREGLSVLREKDLVTENTERAKSMLSVLLKEGGAQGYMLYTDYQNDRDWEKEKDGIKRLSYILFRRLRQLEVMQKELEETNYIISHDSKTDLLNYSNFMLNAEQYVRENPRKRFYLLYSDFSNFQYLNEIYGYAAGDDVLKEFGAYLKAECSHGILFTRVTADHFISLHENTGMEELREEYNRLCKNFCSKVNARYDLCKLVLVSGICEVDRTQDIFAVNIDNANLARKAVKNKTQTLCIPYTDDMRLKAQIQMEISANMENALERGEFAAYLQPKIELATGRLAGAEALVRWHKPDGRMMCPDQFIPVFEKNGFITRIDFEMLRQVLALQRSVLDRGQEPLRISVNFSRQHQENPHLVSQIQEMLEEYNVPGRYLEAEITESVFLYDLDPLNENIWRLQSHGLSVSIDDFGSGYSSLNVLSKVRADIIKLDRQFLLDMEQDHNNKPGEFLTMLIGMIKQLGFRVIAEGVETEEQKELLREAGCEYAQGFYYAKPMPVGEFLEYVSSYKGERL